MVKSFVSILKSAGNLRVEIRTWKFRSPYERARIHAVTCASHKHTYPRGGWRQSGWRTGMQQEQHEYLSRLIYIFLLQIFTDKMTRDRIEAGAAAERHGNLIAKRGDAGAEESEGRKRALRGCWTLYSVTVETRGIRRRENILCHCEEEFQTTRKVCSSSARQSCGNDTLTLASQSDVSTALSECPRERFFRTLHCHSWCEQWRRIKRTGAVDNVRRRRVLKIAGHS